MIGVKKWKFYLLVCLFFVACKSADCGCPMAENEPREMIQQREDLERQKQWKMITK